MRIISKILLLTAVMIVSLCITCFAKLPSNQTSLGGITLFQPISDVLKVYGTPTYFDNSKIEYGTPTTVIIGKTSEWTINEGSGGSKTPIVGIIRVTANNGFATPAGVTVGMDTAVLYKVYGHPDRLMNKKSTPYNIPKRNDYDTLYIYYGTAGHNFAFFVRNEKIIEICLGLGIGALG